MCPFNIKFSRTLAPDSPYVARAELAGKHARTLARELLAMSQEEFRVGFKGSPMKRAKLRGLKRNAAVVRGNSGTAEDVAVLIREPENADPLVREHAHSGSNGSVRAPVERTSARASRHLATSLVSRIF